MGCNLFKKMLILLRTEVVFVSWLVSGPVRVDAARLRVVFEINYIIRLMFQTESIDSNWSRFTIQLRIVYILLYIYIFLVSGPGGASMGRKLRHCIGTLGVSLVRPPQSRLVLKCTSSWLYEISHYGDLNWATLAHITGLSGLWWV